MNDEPSYCKVFDSSWTVSARVLVVLQCVNGMLKIGAILSDADGKQWEVVENDMPIGRPNDAALQKRVKDTYLFLYRLQPIGHNQKPKMDEMLVVT